MKQRDLISAPCCQALSSQKPLLSRSAARGGPRTGSGWGDRVGRLRDEHCQLACAYSMETQETPQSLCQLHPGGSQTGILKKSRINLLKHLKGALHLEDQRQTGSTSLLTPASLVGIPYKSPQSDLDWGICSGAFHSAHHSMQKKKKKKEYRPKNTLLSLATKKKGAPFGT